MHWLVILYPSGTHMKHDGKMKGGIFHCHSEGGMVIHFFLSSSLCYPVPVLVYHSIFAPPPPLPKQWQFNHILRSGMQNNPSSQSMRLIRNRTGEKVQKTDETSEHASSAPKSRTHFSVHTQHLSIEMCPIVAGSSLSPSISRAKK